MIITIKKDDGENVYNVNEIADEAKQGEARVIITKVGTLETLSEAINFATVSINKRSRPPTIKVN